MEVRIPHCLVRFVKSMWIWHLTEIVLHKAVLILIAFCVVNIDIGTIHLSTSIGPTAVV